MRVTWGTAIARSVELRGRRIVSRTRIMNTGQRLLPLQWFSHPFFAPGNDGHAEAELPSCVGMRENTGFALSNSVLRARRRFDGEKDGHFQQLEIGKACRLVASVRGQGGGDVRFTCDFEIDELYAWANGNTFSLEPYLKTELTPGESRSWSVHYEFAGW